MSGQEMKQDNEGKKIVNGCLFLLLFLAFLIGGSCLLFSKNKDSLLENLNEGLQESVKNAFALPYYGEKEYITARYGELINTFKQAAQSNVSLFSFAAAIEKMSLPNEVVYFAISKDGEKTEVIKKIEWSGYSSVVSNGYGAGQLSTNDKTCLVMIYENAGPWSYMDEFVVYIEHLAGEQVPDSM